MIIDDWIIFMIGDAQIIATTVEWSIDNIGNEYDEHWKRSGISNISVNPQTTEYFN